MFPLTRDLREARAYACAVPKGAAVPDVNPTKLPLTAAMAEYVLDFEAAKQKRCLPDFNVQQRLDTVRRVTATMFSFLRSVSGLLILCGLLFTLFNLQRAVGPLGDAFRQLANQQEGASQSHRGTPELGSARDKVNHIQGTMSDVASSAKQAFLFSFCFILAAASTMILVLIRQQHAFASVARFAAWAEQQYRTELPEQISIAEAAHAFKDNAQALGDLTRSFNDLALALEAVKNFSRTMDDTRDAIVKALDAMPGQIQASMGLVSKDMVKNLERTMKDEVEATKQILAIYGQQEFRIDEIRQEVEAVRKFTEKVTLTATSLETIPRHLGAIDTSVKQLTWSAQRFEETGKQIEGAVLAFPSKDLQDSAKALTEASTQVGRAHSQAVDAIAEFQGKSAAALTDVKTQVERTHAELGVAIANLQVESTAGLSDVAAQVGRTHTEVLGAIGELLGKSVATQGDIIRNIGGTRADVAEAMVDLGQKLAAIGSADREIGQKIDAMASASQQFVREFYQMRSELGDDRKLASDNLTEATSRAINEMNKLANKTEVAALGIQVSKVDSTLENFLRRLRVRPSGDSIPPSGPLPQAQSAHFDAPRVEGAVAGAAGNGSGRAGAGQSTHLEDAQGVFGRDEPSRRNGSDGDGVA